jgi:hypothetical protein
MTVFLFYELFDFLDGEMPLIVAIGSAECFLELKS